MKRFISLAGIALALALTGCDEPIPPGRGVYMLMDTSGTYTGELKQAQRIINAILARLDPGDSFAVARIDTGSFSEKDIIAKITFDDRPSMANQQKRKFRQQVDDFVRKVKPAAYTDVTGGVLQAIAITVPLGVPTKSPPKVVQLLVLKKRCIQVASPVVEAVPFPPGEPAFDVPSPHELVTLCRSKSKVPPPLGVRFTTIFSST